MLQQGMNRRGWASEADLRPPLQHWHSAPYSTLEGYRLEVDATRMKDACAAEPSDAKTDFTSMDPLSQLQVTIPNQIRNNNDLQLSAPHRSCSSLS